MQLPLLRQPSVGEIPGGLAGAARALLLARFGRPLLVLCRGEEEAARLHGDLQFFAAALAQPPPVLVPAPERRLRSPRLAALARIGAGDAAIVVAELAAALAPAFDAAALHAGAVELRVGGEVDADFLAELLGEMGYRRVQVVADAGEYALRQGRLDVFPAAGEHPVRVEHAAGRATAVRAFDVGTQRTYRDLEAVRLLPAVEPEGGAPLFEALAGRFVVADGDLGPESAGLPAPDLVLTEPLLGLEREGWRGAGDPVGAQRLASTDGGAQRQDPEATHGDDPDPPAVCVRPVHGFGLTARERRAAGEGLGVLGPRLAAVAAQRSVLIAAETLGEAERLRDLLGEAGLPVAILSPGDVGAHPGPLALVHGRLSGGFLDAGSGLLAITGAELFGPRPPSRVAPASRVGGLIAALDELAPGDHVVHLDHGVGRFAGIERAHDQDFLRLEYAGGGRLLVPVERIDLLRRHGGAGAAPPRLDTIGGAAWRAAKGRAREKVREMAAELLRQAAEREAAAGIACAPDDARHREFADAFAFEPTPDQRESVEKIRAAMELARPMDWLLCGDVGYGKTEVAMRAAFKVVADGRQVAVIAPTTVLAEQHADVFAARFAPFPVRVDALTRFTPRDGERAALAGAASGETGILVGTHRLLAADVAFADLGLVIVDEEQRFGVEHKERIRRLRPGVDVLTLTATPIPRTLSMALAGVRGISTLETPPEERLAAKTVVCRFDGRVVREALEREFARGGQAFFVHNRIDSIARVGVWLQGLLPGRRIGVAHARLPGPALEEVMHRFHAGEIDLLLATAIVGAGLDVPNANTLIVDRADRFGLADLYQLKGRVGRADRRAFAYFLVPHEDRITDDAKLRLEALGELSYLGAGFRLALRDLEIRGAGDLLGAEQSGHIAAIGFDLYLEMLAEAVAELRGEAAPVLVAPVLELRLAAHLPAAWVDDPALRFSVLRKIAAARDAAAVADLRRELADRFGPPPPEAAHLLDLAELKAACRAAGVARIVEVADRRYRVELAACAPPAVRALEAIEKLLGARVDEEPAGFTVDLAKRSWGEIARLLPRALALLG
jgi:transcription-repair coupling factor (superfamily II helicase)